MNHLMLYEDFGYGFASFEIPIINVNPDNRDRLKSDKIVSIGSPDLPAAIAIRNLMKELKEKGLTKAVSASSLFKRAYKEDRHIWLEAKTAKIAAAVKR
jgi:hypothetical protein